MKVSPKIVLSIALITIFLALGYAQLGGFRPIQLALVECDDFELVGVEYFGTPQDQKLGGSFQRVEEIKEDNPGAMLHTIYYIEPAGKRDTMHLFVGVQKAALNGSFSTMTEKEVTCRRVVIAKISANRFVMPSPLRIKEKIKKFASEKGVVLQEIYVDKLLDDSHVEVWAPLIDD